MVSIMSSLAVLIILFIHFHRIDSKCIDFAFVYKDKCYLTLRPVHVRDMRYVLDKTASSIVVSASMAEKVCSSVDKMPISKDNPRARDEATDFTRLVSKFRPKLAILLDKDHLKWLQGKAYGSAILRYGSAFLASSTESSALFNNDTENGFNKGTCPYIFFDPVRPFFQKLIWVDCNNPYAPTLPHRFKSQNIICEYEKPKDCFLKPVVDKCLVDTHGFCKFYTHSLKIIPDDKVDGHYEDCPPVKNETQDCPERKIHECDRDCQWGEWTLLRQCTHCKLRSLWMRKKAQGKYGSGKECEGDLSKYIWCTCDGAARSGLVWCVAIVALAGSYLRKFYS